MLRRVCLWTTILVCVVSRLRAEEPADKEKQANLEAAKKAFAAIDSSFRGFHNTPAGRSYPAFAFPQRRTEAFLKKVPDVTVPYGFDFFSCKLTDEGYAELPRLKNLAFLSLVRQPVGPARLKILAECPGLQCVNLAGATEVTDEGITHLARSRTIRELSLEGTGVTGKGLLEIAKMTQLEHLSLARDQVTTESLKPLKSLVKIRSLNFFEPREFNQAGLAAFRDAESLESISSYLSEANDAMLKEFGRHRNLKYLSISSLKFTDDGVKELRLLTKMEHLDISFSKITDASLPHLAGMTKLKSLNLSATSITDAAIADLRGFKDLESLSIVSTKITKEGLETLKKALPKCRVRYNSTDF